MSDRGRLFMTGIAALGVVGATVAGGQSALRLFHGGAEHDAPTMRQMAGLKDFSRIVAQGPDNVVVTRGARFSVRAEGNARDIDRLALRVEGGVLHVERSGGKAWRPDGAPTTIRITLPQLSRVDLVGSGNMRVDRMDGAEASASLTGGGELWIGDMSARTVDLALSGSGTLSVAGHADDVTMNQTGSGTLLAGQLDARTASIRLVGSGNVVARAHDKADLTLLGSGNAHVDGTTECRISRAGSGEASCKT
jgi:hypothetical protein